MHILNYNLCDGMKSVDFMLCFLVWPQSQPRSIVLFSHPPSLSLCGSLFNSLLLTAISFILSDLNELIFNFPFSVTSIHPFCQPDIPLPTQISSKIVIANTHKSINNMKQNQINLKPQKLEHAKSFSLFSGKFLHGI